MPRSRAAQPLVNHQRGKSESFFPFQKAVQGGSECLGPVRLSIKADVSKKITGALFGGMQSASRTACAPDLLDLAVHLALAPGRRPLHHLLQDSYLPLTLGIVQGRTWRDSREWPRARPGSWYGPAGGRRTQLGHGGFVEVKVTFTIAMAILPYSDFNQRFARREQKR